MSNYSEIDLDKVKEEVCKYCAISDAKDYIRSEEVVFNPLLIKNNLKETGEAYELLKNNFNLSFDGIENLNDLFLKASKDICLSSDELASILSFSNHCLRIKNKILSIEKDLAIKSYGESLFVDLDLNKRIDKVVDVNGNIKEDASSKLKEIFVKINKNDNDIHSLTASFISKHGASLQENTPFLRNDRVVFLFKNSDKNKFNGFQYGSSASGLASYVEPGEFIELNNRRLALEDDKNKECERLLRELTYYVSRVSDNYILNFESLLKLDVLFAKAEYGFYNAGVVASLSYDEELYLKDICHPLIAKKDVVSNTYSLKKPYNGIVISGTNTGGKTVGLKLIGLSVLMSYLGIPLLAESAKIPFYDNIYIDIDDNQSISNALSTFSAHISNINRILKEANQKSLILIDELISGTDPKEAQAISLSILKKLLDKEVKFVITTHYDDIKKFAYKDSRILLSSVGFDMDNLRPTYKYIEDSIGVSNAIDIASRYFDDQSIIEDARKYLDLSKTREEELLEKLAKEISDNERLREELKKEVADNKKLNEELRRKNIDFENEKTKLKEKYLIELNNYIEDIKEKALDKLNSFNDKKDKEIVFKQLDNLKKEERVKEEVVFMVNDKVRIASGSGVGEIISIDKDNVSVNVNGMIIKTKLNNLEKINVLKKQEYKPRQKLNRVSKELNLVGERVEEALVILDNYLDSAYGSGLSQVKIIHGFGTGQLRKAIREHLKKNKIVLSFDNGDMYDGGSNVTIVKFK